MSLSVKTMVSCFEMLLEPESCGCCLSSTPGSAHQPASGSPKRGASPGRLKRIDPQTRGRSFCWGAIETGNEGCKKREESTDQKKREESIDQKKREESIDHKREESIDQKKREESIDHKREESIDQKKREESIDQKKREESIDHKKREESIDQKKREESIDHKKREESIDQKKREESIDQKKREESIDHKKREESIDQKREESIDHKQPGQDQERSNKKREACGVDGVQAGAPETEAKMNRVPRLRTPPTTPGRILKHGGTTMAFSRNIDTTILSLLLFFEGGSGSSMVAIDNKIEQAMDLVKSHLMFAVREEVEVLKEQIKELAERNSVLERENSLLRAIASPEQLNQLQGERGSTIASPEQLNQLQGERGSTIASPEQLNQLQGERGAETPRDSPKSNGNTTSNNNNNNNNNNNHNIDSSSSSSSTAPLV